jgi:VWFA-related protein
MRLLTVAFLLLLPAILAAQQTGQNAPLDGSNAYTLTLKSQLVVEAVTVKDKGGNPITGLTAKDFTLTEDGVAQTIRFSEYQNLPQTVTPLRPDANEDVRVFRKLNSTQFSTEKPGVQKYRDRRLLAMYFDMTAMRPEDQIRALAAAEKFVRTQMTEADRVALLRYTGGGVDVLHDFTADRSALLSILETLAVGEGQGNDEEPGDAGAADAGAAFGQDSGEFNIFNTDRQLSALQTAAQMLGNLNERKALIYFASGLRLNGLDNQAQLHATVDEAIRAGVSFWPIDARGLVAGAPLGDATQGSPGNAGMYTGAAAGAQRGNFQQSQDTLYALAGDTGGKALFDSNDLGRGILQAQDSVGSYYILGYYTTNTALNGQFRKINVTVNVPDARLDYRKGYYAGKVFAKFTATDKERQLEDALLLNDPITDLTIAMEIDYFQLNRAEYFVPISVKIPGRELALAKRGGAEHTVIDFVGEVKDNAGGMTATNLHDKVDLRLTDATAAELANRPIEYAAGFTLLPGKYTIKFLARDDETGRIGTYQTTFVIPNLNRMETAEPPDADAHVAISSVVLSGQLAAAREGLYNANKDKESAKEETVDPLVENGRKLVPSVTRVFSQARNLYVFLQAYQQNSTTTEPLVAYVTLYRGGVRVVETRPVEVARAVSVRLQAMPVHFTVPLAGVPAGDYDCQVTVLDPQGHRATFWQGPLRVVP